MKITRATSGMTLTELLVVTGLLTSLSAMVYTTFQHNTQTYTKQSAQSMTQDKLRIWLDRMVKDVRRAAYDPKETGLFDIDPSFSTTSFQFTSDTNANGVVDAPGEYLGYKFDNGTLFARTGPSGWRAVLTGVGSLRFTYRDVKGNIVSTVVDEISSVEVALSAEASTSTASGNSATTTYTPSITVGSQRTTISVPGGTTTTTVYGRVDRAALRNPR